MAALVLALFLVACNRVGNDSNGTGTPDPTGTAATATPAGDVTQGVTPGGKPTGEPETTPTAAPEPTGTAVEWPEFGQYKPTEIPELSGITGTPGRANESTYFRTEPGRTKTRLLTLAKDSRFLVLDSYLSIYNETWYRIAVILNERIYYGYVQASSVDLGDYRSDNQKTRLQANGLAYTPLYGPDRDGDGIYVVVLDPGHGGPYSGASHYGKTEKNINLEVAKFCKKYLETVYDNVVVYLTRSGDYVFDPRDDVDDLEYRVLFARNHNADILVSLHFDAYNGRENGAEGLVPRKKEIAPKAKALASLILRNLEKLGIRNLETMTRLSGNSRYSYPNGEQMDGYLIHRLASEVGIVSCIIEHAHMDHESDFARFIGPEGMLEKIGIADAEGIAEFLQLKKKEQ